jgi:acyl-CoA thioesterase I
VRSGGVKGQKEFWRRARRLSLGTAGPAVLVLLVACGSGRTQTGSVVGRSDSTTPTESRATQLRGASDTSRGPEAAAARSTIVFAGTSLTAGLGLEPDSAYPMLIQRKIDSAGLPFQVVNAGVSGETSSGLLDRLNWLLRGAFDVFVVETGANDGLRGIPASTLKTNLETTLDRVKAQRPEATIILIQMEALPNLGARYTSAFHAVFPAVAREKGVTLLPFLLDGVAGHRGLNQGDGVHPNNAGERIVATNIWRGLEPILAARAQK